MGNKEYKTSEEVKQRAEEAIGHSFKEIFELAQKFQQENGSKEKHGKGDIGQAYEEGWFNYACNEDAEPDFKDADIELKVTPFLINSTVDEKGTPTQDMSFSAFDFDGLLKEKNWTESIAYDEMVDSKFLIVLFSKNAEGKEILNNALVWYIPKKDINKVKEVWKETRKVIKNGIKLQQKLSHDRVGRLMYIYENNFPKSNFNKVAHVRNKAGESEYFCENANSVRLKKPAKVITLKEIPEELKEVPIPTGEYMTKQCFWFNKKYMKQQVKDFIKSY